MGDDAQAVIFERTESVCSALYQFHFSVEALRDAVVAGEAPHASDLLGPIAEGLCQGVSVLEGGIPELADDRKQLPDVTADTALGLVFVAKEGRQALLHLVDRNQSWVRLQELLQAPPLLGIEPIGSGPQ